YLGGSFQRWSSAPGANPALDLAPQGVQRDWGGVNISQGRAICDLLGSERFANHVRAHRRSRSAAMPDGASRAARDLECTCHIFSPLLVVFLDAKEPRSLSPAELDHDKFLFRFPAETVKEAAQC